MSEYFDELRRAMTRVSDLPNSVFIGQAVACPGTAMSRTLDHLPREKRIEFPVAEDMQMGVAIGMSINGLMPVCVYPRWNFLLLAASQLVLHLDKLPAYSRGGWRPRVLVRVAVATDEPLDPGHQHLGNFSEAFRSMLQTVRVVEMRTPREVREGYDGALSYEASTILVEFSEMYA